MKVCRYNIIALVLTVLPMLVSCRQELCYDHYPVLDIQFSWEQEWERDYGKYHIDEWDEDYYGCEYDEIRPGMPEWVNMVSYYDDGRQSDAFMSPSGKRFIVDAGEGRSVLLYNGDTEFIVLSDVASMNDARATATSRSRSRISLTAMYETYQNARTTNPPDVLYSAFIEDIPGISNHEVREMPVKMQPLVFTYIIKYEFEYGIQHVALARGALGGMAESVYLRTGVSSDESTIILFDCDIKDSGCQANVRSFGIPGFPDSYYGQTAPTAIDHPYTLNLEVMLRNGKTLEFNFDISDQIKNQPRGGVITVGGIKIEDEQGASDSGFDVGVDDWGDEGDIIDLPIGGQTNK